ncbi:hypothetical protein FA13DRAFT_876707 [Coprinellus micaceus]|uniref:F-box domain-containing protein n=1 Tax=Coprinellus micaceus TaxID=71717 RepID=A0A4Y7SGY7_COPMI|nr:hypothetical protein FA13DRAFT_166272 [Coprinellus micaceus]TEB27621.1 hypothetical protein FA13DRAFT_876707 [Coprinellus micaceus]
MEAPSPFEQHLDTNYIPTSEKLNGLKALVEERQVIIDAIDADIADLERRKAELKRKRAAHAQYVRRHSDLATPVLGLPGGILLAILVELLTLAKPWPTHHPSIIASQVCRRWRDLTLSTPLL